MEQDASQSSAMVALVDVVFAIVGFSYAAQVLQPIPMTYLSEIAFPFDFCVKLACSIALLVLHATHWLLDAMDGTQWHQRATTYSHGNHAGQVLFQVTAWGVASVLLWMEHRRSRPPSLFLRAFWLFNWAALTTELFANERVNHVSLGTSSPFAIALAALVYSCSAILGASCFFTATPVTSDLIELPLISTPTAYLHSANFKLPLSGYGTFGNYDILSRASTTMAIRTNEGNEDEPVVAHSVSSRSISRLAVITATIPSSTTSIWGKNQFVSYKVVVQTEDDRWCVRRQYSDFVSLHDELPSAVKEECPLPPDDNARQFLSWKRKPTPMKIRLEKYLQRVLSHKAFEPHSSQALCDFLETEYVDEALLQLVYSAPPSIAPPSSTWSAQAA